MKVFVKFNIPTVCSLFLGEKLEDLVSDFHSVSLNEIVIDEAIDSKRLKAIKEKLGSYGIEIIEDHKMVLVERIKEVINQMNFADNTSSSLKNSAYLSEKLNLSYGYLSNVFSEITHISIEDFIILQKVERAKELIIQNELNFTEIAFLLNYSSLSHFSIQFKNSTGVSPSSFQRIIRKRRQTMQVA